MTGADFTRSALPFPRIHRAARPFIWVTTVTQYSDLLFLNVRRREWHVEAVESVPHVNRVRGKVGYRYVISGLSGAFT